MTLTDRVDPAEVEIRELLGRTMTEAPLPLAMGPRALRDGRRLRRRRRIGMAAGALSTAAMALMLPAALGGDAPAPGDPANVATAPAPTPSPSAASPGWWDQRADAMVTIVEGIVPDGVAVTPSGIAGAGHIALRLDGPQSAGRLYLNLSPVPPLGDVLVLVNCTRCHGGNTRLPPVNLTNIGCPETLSRAVQCAELRDSDGALVGRRTSLTTRATTWLEVVVRRDGGAIIGTTTSTSSDTGNPSVGAPAAAPPLTLDQLEDLVRDDAWVRPPG